MQLSGYEKCQKLIYREIDNHTNFSVTKREENTRSHPEHGRKDSLR